MYERFYGLAERPFDLTPNPKFLLLTEKYSEALSHVQYGVASSTGVTLLTGETGTGKTTLLQAAAERLQQTSGDMIVWLRNPTLTRDEFVTFLAKGFGLSPLACYSKTEMLQEITQLLERRRAGDRVALFVDEAQSLPAALLEEVRLLANLETSSTKLLPIVLAAQSQFAARLNQPELQAFKLRIALRCSLDPLTLSETASYIAQRIRIAGGDAAQLFTDEAVLAIHERSRGIPRTINVVCNNALISGFATNERPVGDRLVREVCENLDLGPLDGTKAAAVRPVAKRRVSSAHRPTSKESDGLPVMAAQATARGRILDQLGFRRPSWLRLDR